MGATAIFRLVALVIGKNGVWFIKKAKNMIELLSDPQIWIVFATLTLLELVLGIDNIIFISI